MKTPIQIVQEQINDDGLWFIARTAPEAYLQQELRRLHAAVEQPIDDERTRRAIEALRKPDASLASVANTIRQSLAEVIEDLCAQVVALRHFAVPHEALTATKPLAVYFATDADREEFIAAMAAAKPNMRSVKL